MERGVCVAARLYCVHPLQHPTSIGVMQHKTLNIIIYF